MSRHSWEDPVPVGRPAAAHSWEQDDDAVDDEPTGAASDVESDVDDTPTYWAYEFLDFLLSIHLSGALSARCLCILCYFAGKAGMPSFIASFGVPPGRPSGHYNRKVRKCLGESGDNPKDYCMKIPGHRRHDLARTNHDVSVRPGHESVAKEMETDPTLPLRIQEAIEDGSLPRAYTDNAVVRETKVRFFHSGCMSMAFRTAAPTVFWDAGLST